MWWHDRAELPLIALVAQRLRAEWDIQSRLVYLTRTLS